MQVVDGSRRQPAAAVPAAGLEGPGVGGGDLLGPDLRQDGLPQQAGRGSCERSPDSAQRCGARRTARRGRATRRGTTASEVLDGSTYEPPAISVMRREHSTLRLPLGPGERVPLALSLARLRVADSKHDGPVAGRAFANLTPHRFACLFLNAATLQAFELNFDVLRRPVPAP